MIATDPAAALRSPAIIRGLPPTLDQGAATAMLDAALATAAETGGAVGRA